MVALSSRLLIFGGTGPNFNFLNDVWVSLDSGGYVIHIRHPILKHNSVLEIEWDGSLVPPRQPGRCWAHHAI
jgi:hypothetical protein